MPYSIQCDQDDAKEFASLGGMRDLRQWAAGLPDETSIELQHLLAHGWTQEVSELRQQLRDSLELRPPAADVADCVRAILDATRDEAEVASVTDGLGAGKGGSHRPSTKDWDESKHPRDSKGRFGSGFDEQGNLVSVGGKTVTGGVEVNHPAVLHITKQIRELNRLRDKLPKDHPNRDKLLEHINELKANRRAVWEAALAGKKAPVAATVSGKPKPFETHDEWAKWMKGEDGKLASNQGKNGMLNNVQTWIGSSSYVRNDQMAAEKTGSLVSTRTLAFESAIARAPRYGGEIMRGIRLDTGSDALKKFTTVGTEVKTNTHDSWTKLKDISEAFGSAWGTQESVILHMAKSTTGGSIVGLNPSEGEVVVPRGTRYRVQKVDTTTKATAYGPKTVHHVHVEEM